MPIQFSPPSVPYQEGIWTPVLAGATTPGTQTYSTQVGWYIRTGNLVVAGFNIVLSAFDVATAGTMVLNGLPFVASNTTNQNPPAALGAIGNVALTALYTQFTARVSANTSQIVLQQSGSGQANAVLVAAAFASNASIAGVLSYRIN